MIIVPPLKCQGIKTKLVPAVQECLARAIDGCWIEPFCGSGVVALNVQPERALLADKNRHIIQLYQQIQQGLITPAMVRQHLERAGVQLRQHGQDYYNEVRTRFNEEGDSLDFLFFESRVLQRGHAIQSAGAFNVPFGHKPDRFRPAYITKIVNQVRKFQSVVTRLNWRFEVADFRETLAQANPEDFIYADPPYLGRYTDYYTTWNETDEAALITILKATPARFLFSTWHHNRHRTNPLIDQHWQNGPFSIRLIEHFYHVGPSEARRGEMLEALIGNYPFPERAATAPAPTQLFLFDD